MAGLLYFAYGSNLLTERLRARCPSAEVVGRATLPRHRVAFAKWSDTDFSSKATILPDPGAVAMGVLFELSALDLNVLDAFEGVGRGYDRLEDVEVITGRGRARAVTYIASDPRSTVPPWDWYLALVIAGARQHGLGGGVVSALEAHPHMPDDETARPARLAALEALQAAGHGAWQRLLEGSPRTGRR